MDVVAGLKRPPGAQRAPDRQLRSETGCAYGFDDLKPPIQDR